MKREIFCPIPLVSERRHRPELLRKAFPPLILGIITVVVVTLPARALLFNVSYDASVANAPVAFQAAFQNATSFYQSTYTDPITINIDVGWGEIDGNPLTPGNLGQSRTNQPGNFSYSQVRSALISDAKSAADFQAVSTLRAADPTSGRAFRMSDAEACVSSQRHAQEATARALQTSVTLTVLTP